MNVRNGIENLAQIASTQTVVPSVAAKSNNRSGETLAADTTQLSATASQVAQSATDSDVRLDKVSSIRDQLESGTYSVAAIDVAKKVIDSILT